MVDIFLFILIAVNLIVKNIIQTKELDTEQIVRYSYSFFTCNL